MREGERDGGDRWGGGKAIVGYIERSKNDSEWRGD